MTTIDGRLQQVKHRINAACLAAGRAPGDVGLLAVSKTQSPEAVREAHASGQCAFGENYIQEGVEKILELRDLPLVWHMIGPVQSNKTRVVAEHFDWVQSVDRLKIAERLSAQRPDHLPPLNVCVQVNIDAGPNKSGVAPEDALALAHGISALPRLRLRGLMALPEPTPDFIAQKLVFTRALAVFDQILAARLPGWAEFDTLSLGMSADLEAAIAAGSTLVRVGTAVFGERPAR
ncbi:MAG: YggS family pyridoxal phosphate-dependent enzyme [Polaromonas sp.]|nr:YggS family pyridoxal phosphate-dependent enzyme [Polaromonas sp.]